MRLSPTKPVILAVFLMRCQLVGQLHPHEDIAREELALRGFLLAAHELDHGFLGNDHFRDEVFLLERLHALLERQLRLVFHAGMGVHHVPFVVGVIHVGERLALDGRLRRFDRRVYHFRFLIFVFVTKHDMPPPGRISPGSTR